MNWNQKASVAIIAFAACSAAQAGNRGITASVAAEKATLGKADNVTVRLTLTNTSAQPQLILKWHTAFGEIEESLFEITRDGVKVPYLGAHYKRGAPTAGDYYLLQPGASHTVKVELSDMYDMSITGQYTVSYSARSGNLFGTSERSVGEVKSGAASIWIDGRLPRGTQSDALAKAAQPPAPAAAGLAFNKCTTSQQATVTQAISAATSMASGADAYMGGNLGARYVKWFGSVDAGRVNTVKAHFVAIKDAFQTKPITVDCGCKKTYYAYVYPTQPYTIYVCKAFWTAPLTGTDSKGGTLVHEMSHFNATAGTDDWVYGQSGAASLAISDPAKAIDNADSHEYFSENTPGLN
ncbi:M35 family metallo-endopeptidase [Massilia sp. CF038]|uniref:M35 family metallo-endopeptidase n=1 Tax=Massilia sp. CF038 TaxID=1881045 RepID=UPI00091C0485|nr:M35 family metallo-endopeptidase [Massilia sp. CF038]SHG44112.1 peptidyl-Lys metalloendopeptidase [Massilia sp. CF038]